MVAVSPQMVLPDERQREYRAAGESDVASCLVVGKDVGGGGGEKRRRFDEGDVGSREVGGEKCDDLVLYAGCCFG